MKDWNSRMVLASWEVTISVSLGKTLSETLEQKNTGERSGY